MTSFSFLFVFFVFILIIFLQEEIEAHKKDWELEHLKSLKAEAERAEVEPTSKSGSLEEPLTIPRETALNQVKSSKSNTVNSSSNQSVSGKRKSDVLGSRTQPVRMSSRLRGTD